MSAYGTKLAEGFSAQIVRYNYQKSVVESITNNRYEGELGDGSILNIPTIGKASVQNYTGANLSPDDVTESTSQLITNQRKAIYFKVLDLKRFESYIKDPKNTIVEDWQKSLKQVQDAYVLSLYPDVAAGQRIGTDYVTGDVTVAADTGVVTGNGTTFTAAMAGRGFKATGHTKFYRVKHFTSTTQIEIEDDLDDETSAYTGGAIAGGSSYKITAATAVQATKSTIFTQVLGLKTILDKALVPKEDRFIVLPSDICNLLPLSTEMTPAVSQAYDTEILRGMTDMVAGFRVFSNEQVAGDATNGYHCLAGHISGITFASGMTKTGMEEDLIGNFGAAYKGLYIYGAKVPDIRRNCLAEAFLKL